ncbi:MAG: redox-regulated ATPase YchF [Candidatus Diapherotrites archaeon]|nr:redox-regulated ATPase YchF [Candidatus Diapherotrites archaeon]
MQIGIVGKPSSGKSTFFSAATLVDVAIANYPFTTIEPNKGMGFVRVECIDKEFNVQCNPRTGFCEKGIRFVPVELIDVAGLVPGASEGRGRGNQFLSDLAQADVLIHVVDASGSTNSEGELVALGSHDPSKDIGFLEEEIDAWFFGILEKNWKKFYKTPAESKLKLLELMSQNLSGIGASPKSIETALAKNELTEKKLELWSDDEKKSFARQLRIASKPMVIAANKADLQGSDKNIERMKGQFPHLLILPCSGISELTLKKAAKDKKIKYLPGEKTFEVLAGLDEKQKKGLEYIQKNVLEKFGNTGIQEILDRAVFEFLGMVAIFPAGTKKLSDQYGNVLPDCYLMPKGSTVLDFAFKLHTDFGNNFIKAVNVKTKQLIGKEHLLQNRDAIEIIHKG